MNAVSVSLLVAFLFSFGLSAQENPPAQEESPRPQDNSQNAAPAPNQRWNFFYQSTSIGADHGTFNAPYSGRNSLASNSERDVSLTATLFFGFRAAANTIIYFDPELAGGRGFSAVTGLANASNGELPRVASATPTPYIARLYIQQDFALGKETENFESDENQLAGSRPAKRYTIVAGRFTLTDFFDNNRYTHDPRTQFMAWGVMYNGAWDYPADTRGYTWGWMHELRIKRWSVRYASAAEPKIANGPRFDRRLFRDRGDVVEGEFRVAVNGHAGAVRALGFLNHSDSGNYEEAVALANATHTTPDINSTLKVGTRKYGFGVSADQEITRDAGVFLRLGWNDGKTEDFAFTAIDRLASSGLSVTGARWGRPADTVATSFTAAGLSGAHAVYLARGGLDFIIGDGKLNYAPEYLWESYYSAQVVRGFFVGFDAQHYENPAYNHDRGPLWAFSIRLHIEGAAFK
jgi:high affinity Mn2+ porin